MPNDHRTDIRAYARDTERTMRSALWHAQGLCPACGEESDYCQGHGPIGDPAGAAILDQFPQDEDAWDWFAAWALDVEHTARINNMGDPADPEETRLLLTYGGPTVWATYSHRYGTAELMHSWGREPMPHAAHERDPDRPSGLRGVAGTETGDPADCADRTTWPLDPDLVGEFISTFTPHPLEV